MGIHIIYEYMLWPASNIPVEKFKFFTVFLTCAKSEVYSQYIKWGGGGVREQTLVGIYVLPPTNWPIRYVNRTTTILPIMFFSLVSLSTTPDLKFSTRINGARQKSLSVDSWGRGGGRTTLPLIRQGFLRTP